MGNQNAPSGGGSLKSVKSKRGSFTSTFNSMLKMGGSDSKSANHSFAESESERLTVQAKAKHAAKVANQKKPVAPPAGQTAPQPERQGRSGNAPAPPPGPPPASAKDELAPAPTKFARPTEFTHMVAPPPPRRNSTKVLEAWYNKTYLSIMHLGRCDGSLMCPQCRETIASTPANPDGREVVEKFVSCSKCESTWPLVAARMVPKAPGLERWVRDIDPKRNQLCWVRMLTGGEEERLRKLLEGFQTLELEDIKSRLNALNSIYHNSQAQSELALQLAIATAWHGREFDHIAFCRRFLPSGLLEWQPVADNFLDPAQNFKELKVTSDEIRRLKTEASLPERIAWFNEQLLKLKAEGDKGKAGALTIKVRRDCVLEDASTCFMTISPKELWRACKYEFVDEIAIDAGGVAREFFSLIAAQIFDPQLGLFEPVNTADGLLCYRINLNSGLANELHLQYFRFLGRVMAKGLLDGYTVPCHLTRDLYKHLIGEPISLEDLNLIDPQLAKSMYEVLECPDVEALSLDFTTAVWEMGVTNQVELVENGSQIAVTAENIERYLSLMLKFVMLDRHELQLSFLLKGFEEVVPQTLISVFTAREFEGILSGRDKVDVEDWKMNTDYRGKYAKHGENHEVVDWFWNYVESLDEQKRGKLLQFATGSARVPLQGFKALRGSDGDTLLFSIESVPMSQSKYPRAHTCFNRLELPLYKSEEELKECFDEVFDIGVTGFNLDE